jgi:hypothetical protein
LYTDDAYNRNGEKDGLRHSSSPKAFGGTGGHLAYLNGVG